MESNHKVYYNLIILIEQNDLDIHQISTINKDLTAGRYFDMLSELLENAPMFKECLQNLINRDSDRNTYRNLADMLTLLINMGYEKHEAEYDGILDAYDRGQSRLSVMYAKKILDSFNNLCARIEAAKMTESPEEFDIDPYGVSIKEWLDYLYSKDACDKPVILAVDDSPMILKSVSSLLSNDYKVYMLAKSTMLKRMLNQIKPDLFLLDYNMPDINGFELIPVIRSIEQHKDTPIIFLTSEGTIDNISSAIMLGACDFIAKPVQPSTLRSRIGKHIDQRNAGLESVS